MTAGEKTDNPMSGDLEICLNDGCPGPDWSPLLRFSFSEQEQATDAAVQVSLALAPEYGEVLESWWTRNEVQSGRDGEVWYARSELLTMARVQCLPSDDFAAATEAAYAALLSWLDATELSCIYRIWNYFPGITSGAGDTERYRQFSVGRMRAFRQARLIQDGEFPAATAIGTQVGSMHIVALAGAQPAEFLENPRQTSAWNYPRKYGPQSPSFARACVLSHSDPSWTLVSGTASVLGHLTVHPGEWESQLDEAIRNVNALTGHRRAKALRLYVGAGVPFKAACQRLSKAFPGLQIVVIRGDVCRDDLLVEIEGVWEADGSSDSSQ